MFYTINIFLKVTLSEMFELQKEAVHAIVSKMIISEELMASLDEPTQCMVMHRTEPSRLQSLALQLSDKISQLVENNERLLELRPGKLKFVFAHNYTIYKYVLSIDHSLFLVF